MLVYHYHPETFELLGVSTADENPLKPEEFLIPAYATELAPPAPVEGFHRRFTGDGWEQVEIPVPPEPPVDVNGNIRNAPEGLFGGPTIGELFHGN